MAQGRVSPPDLGAQTLVHGVLWDLHEVTVAQVKRYAAATGFVSLAEKEGIGIIYEPGWAQKKVGIGARLLVCRRKMQNLQFI